MTVAFKNVVCKNSHNFDQPPIYAITDFHIRVHFEITCNYLCVHMTIPRSVEDSTEDPYTKHLQGYVQYWMCLCVNCSTHPIDEHLLFKSDQSMVCLPLCWWSASSFTHQVLQDLAISSAILDDVTCPNIVTLYLCSHHHAFCWRRTFGIPFAMLKLKSNNVDKMGSCRQMYPKDLQGQIILP